MRENLRTAGVVAAIALVLASHPATAIPREGDTAGRAGIPEVGIENASDAGGGAYNLTVTAPDRLRRGENLTVTVRATRGNRSVRVEAVRHDGARMGPVTLELNASGVARHDFGSVRKAGTYEVRATAPVAGIVARTTVEVWSVGRSPMAVFDDKIMAVDRGDVASIPVSIDRNGFESVRSAVLRVGGRGSGYLARAVVVDGDGDGRIRVRWNTRRAGHVPADGPDGTVFTAAGGDRIRSARRLSGRLPRNETLPAGPYPTNLTIEGHETDVGTVDVRPPGDPNRTTNLTISTPDAVGPDGNVTATVRVEGAEASLRAVLRGESGRVAGPIAVRPNASGVDRIDFGAAPEPGLYVVAVTRDGTVLATRGVRVSPLVVTVLDTEPGYDAYGEQADYQLMGITNASVTVRVVNEGDGATTAGIVLSVEGERVRTRNVRLDPGQGRKVTLAVDPGETPGEYPFVLRVNNRTRRGTLTLILTSPATPTRTAHSTPTGTDGVTPTRTAETESPPARTTDTRSGGGDRPTPGFGATLGILGVLGGLLVAIRRGDRE